MAQVIAITQAMQKKNPVIEVHLDDSQVGYIYYEESLVLQRLKYYPYIMMGIIGLFLLVSYILFSAFRKAEQNQVWVGLAKETAHQLGTPLSSLMAWVEYLRLKGAVEENTLTELSKDISRLETITERFSKIGSIPKLESENLNAVIEDSLSYLINIVLTPVSFLFNMIAKLKPDLLIQVLKKTLSKN